MNTFYTIALIVLAWLAIGALALYGFAKLPRDSRDD